VFGQAMAKATEGTLEERLAQAEAALAQALAERNALWEELNRRNACEEELAHTRQMLTWLTASLSWRITKPLRAGRGALRARRSKSRQA